jgi:MtN3 and saliva related transmembrane protein
MNGNGIHHISKRKRAAETIHLLENIEGIGEKTLNQIKGKILKSFEFYPSDKFWIAMLDKLLMIIAVVSPLMSLPQVYSIYASQSAGSLSLLSWSSWALFNLPWIVYGFVHKQKPIVVMYILWFLMNMSIVLGIILYS